jgi:hypothetical protein
MRLSTPAHPAVNLYPVECFFAMPIHTPSTRFLKSSTKGLIAATASLVVASSPLSQTTPPATVKVGNFIKQSVGTVTDVQAGDLACHMSLKDDQGRAFEEMADFTLCENPKTYLGRRVNLSYTLGTVAADACQGDPSCKKTRPIVLVQSLTVVGAKNTNATPPASTPPAIAGGSTSFCTRQETVVFSCRTGAKMVSVCASNNATPSQGYLQYRFGKASSNDALELVLPQAEVVANQAASGETVPFAGGGGSWLRFKKGGYAYVAYTGIGKWGPKGETQEKSGVVVERNGKTVAALKCTGNTTSELGPDWYDKLGVKTQVNEDFLFPDR